MRLKDILYSIVVSGNSICIKYLLHSVFVALKTTETANNIDQAFLSEGAFKKIYSIDRNGNYNIFYHKQGVYLKSLSNQYCAVYNNEMHFLGTVKNFYPAERLSVANNYPLAVN
jgi:hypothetical protein